MQIGFGGQGEAESSKFLNADGQLDAGAATLNLRVNNAPSRQQRRNWKASCAASTPISHREVPIAYSAIQEEDSWTITRALSGVYKP